MMNNNCPRCKSDNTRWVKGSFSGLAYKRAGFTDKLYICETCKGTFFVKNETWAYDS